MREVRLYLMVLCEDGEFDISVHRDAEGLRARWTERQAAEPQCSALVHAGFSRPHTDEVREVLEQHEGQVLVSAAARWLLPPECDERPHPAVTLDATERVKAMPLHVAMSGWGYTLQDSPADLGSNPAGDARGQPGWTVEEVRRAFAAALKSVNRADPFAIALVVPAWLRSVPVTSLDVGTRCANVLSQQRIRVVGDLAYYTMQQAHDWRGFGAESAVRLANGLIQAAMDRSLEAEYYSSVAGASGAMARDAEDQDGVALEERLRVVDQDDPYAVLDVLPSWVLEAPIDAVPLTTRCENVLRHLGVERVSDLCLYSASDMLRWRNFGQKSMRDLAHSLIAAARAPRPRLNEPHGPDAERYEGEGGDSSRDEAQVPATLLEHIRLVVSARDERAARALIGRLGLEGEPPTFDALGGEMGLTRERVRQIEHRAWQRVQKAGLGAEAAERFKALLSGRDAPLFADLLHVEDSWFVGLSASALRRFLNRACDDEAFSVIEVAGRPIVSSLGQEAWESLHDRALVFAREQAERRAPMSEVRLGIESLATGAGAPELASLLNDQASRSLHFGRREKDVEPLLISVGRKTEDVVRAVLYEAEEPLHIDEILARCQKRDASVGYGNVHRLCQDNALRFGHGVYGTEAHIPLDEEERAYVVEAAVEIVRSGAPGRQWHAAGLLDHLVDTLDDLPDALDKYVLDALLHARSSLVYLGRMTWVAGKEPANRIEIMEAAEAVLRVAGGPLSGDQLKEAISEYRGTGDMEVLFPNEQVVRIAPGVWGLASRDAQPQGPVRVKVFERLTELLRARGRGLHESELIDALGASGMDVSANVTGYGLMNLLHLAPDLHLYRGQLVGLAEWREPRRATLSEAVAQVARELDEPQSMEALIERVRDVLGRPGDTLSIRNALYRAFTYDAEREVYVRAAPEEIEV